MNNYVERTTRYYKILDARDYVSHYRNIRYFERLCAACPNYGRRWGCPPFVPGEFADPVSFEKVGIILIKADLAAGTPADADTLQSIIGPVKADSERLLLKTEKAGDGLAALFTGKCSLCPGQRCARESGQACRHPESVRPSLEALGFDLGRTSSEIFGIGMQWCKNGHAPQYLTLIGGIFYNNPDIEHLFEDY